MNTLRRSFSVSDCAGMAEAWAVDPAVAYVPLARHLLARAGSGVRLRRSRLVPADAAPRGVHRHRRRAFLADAAAAAGRTA